MEFSYMVIVTLCLMGVYHIDGMRLPQDKWSSYEEIDEVPETALNFECPHGFTKLSTGCYYFSGSRKTNWFRAMEECRQRGVHLVSVDNAEENEALGNYLKKYKMGHQWLGGYDLGHEREWVWESNGLPLTFTSWYKKQPDNHKDNEHCLHMRVDFASDQVEWNDAACKMEYQYVCEADPWKFTGLSTGKVKISGTVNIEALQAEEPSNVNPFLEDV